jgi:hypothetical protein
MYNAYKMPTRGCCGRVSDFVDHVAASRGKDVSTYVEFSSDDADEGMVREDTDLDPH